MSFNNYAIAVIKPDALRDGIADSILDDFKEGNLETLLHRRRDIDWGRAAVLYEDTRQSTWYEPGIQSLVGESEIVLLKADNSAIETAIRVRGRSMESGIRLKYGKPTIREMLNAGISEQDALSEAARNRIHVPDNSQKTVEAMLVLFETQDWEILQVVEPGLQEAVQSELRKYSEPQEAPPQL